MKNLIFALLCCVMTALGQGSPLIAPIKDGYDQECDALGRTRSTRISELTAAYLKLLEGAIANAADAAQAAAIRKERDGIVSGLLAPGKIPSLPPEITLAHQRFFGAVSQATLDFENARKKLDAGYLKSLAALASKNKKDTALQREILAERRRVLGIIP